MDLSLVQRSPTECGVSECDLEATTVRKLWPTGGCRKMKKKKSKINKYVPVFH
jgi:hypothetical protein